MKNDPQNLKPTCNKAVFNVFIARKNERERESNQGKKNDIQALANCRNTLYLSLFLRICYLTSNLHFLRAKRENRTFFSLKNYGYLNLNHLYDPKPNKNTCVRVIFA